MNQTGIQKYLQTLTQALKKTKEIENQWQTKLAFVIQVATAGSTVEDIRHYDDVHEVFGHGVVLLERLCNQIEKAKTPLKVNALNRRMFTNYCRYIDDCEELHAVIHHNLGRIDVAQLKAINHQREEHLQTSLATFTLIKEKLGGD